MTVNELQALVYPVVRMVDEHCLSGWISIRWMAQYILLTVILWIAIYPLDGVIYPLIDWAQDIKMFRLTKYHEFVFTCTNLPFIHYFFRDISFLY